MTTITSTATPITLAGIHLVGYTESPKQREETMPFTAAVHRGEQRLGTLKNHGRGGQNVFTPDSPQTMADFTAAEKSFPGIDLGDYAIDLAEALGDLAALAKDLRSTRKVRAVPDATAEHILANATALACYEIPTGPDGVAADVATMLREIPTATSLTYPDRTRGGFWFHTLTR